ncbi:hypothetical protein [Acidaminococcus timonensis]|uniref:hypothetical protein n=1 Tax=Acidaminococcus timonensis TaxID=1871002 RepID=UPI0025F779D8|nr:hypothetical protein [Acidaminococcus timonensis]MDD6570201.1 hypothetical protein [Acidaminococcus sp.]
MKKLGLVAALCLLCSQPAFAMVPLTPNAVQSAQAYGVERKGASLSEVLAPWTVYDRKQMNPYGLRERVVVYTPYLTAAVDARSTANNGDTPTVDQGMKVAKQYDGVLALGVNLSTTVKLEANKLKVKLYQGQNVLTPYYVNLNSASQRDMQVLDKESGDLQDANVWDLEYYVYFDLSKVNPTKPMVMNAYDEYGGTRQFVLNLANMN